MSSPESKIVELEIQIAHIERLYEQLNQVVTEQARESDRTRLRIKELEALVKTLKEKPSAPDDPLDEKPPHY